MIILKSAANLRRPPMRKSTFADIDIPSTARAAPKVSEIAAGVMHQHVSAFGGTVQARLTDVVLGLRESWCAGPALAWVDIYTVDEEARSDLEKRITLALRESFFNFSQFLCGFEILLLQFHETGVVNEQTLLGIEKLFVHRDDHAAKHVCVSDGDGALANINSCLNGASGAGNHCEVHRNSPVVDESCVRTPDSTTRGDTGREGGRHA